MIILLFFAFVSGLVTILAPCIWPLLPIVLSTSLGGGKQKSLGITLGILVTFGVLTIGISYLVTFFGIDPDILRNIAVVILLLLGLTMVIPFFGRIVEGLVSRFAGKLGQGNTARHGFWGGFVTGAALGVIWTPCAGPILAAIATLSATSSVNLGIIIITVFYLLGVGIPLFLFSYGGQRLVANTRFLSKYTGRIQQAFGVILLLTAILIATNYDKVIQIKILDALPAYSNLLTSFEKSETVTNELNKLTGRKTLKTSNSDLFNANTPAPEFTGITKWLNTPDGKALTLEELKGKVVLIDFWTYTCINCIRTLPHVTSWYDKYNKDGFVVIGVHTPEFEFEKDTQNVEKAIKDYKINYPVAQDNDFATWNAYSNQYWPAEYLIDANGVIRRVHFGEGEYEEMEEAIRLLLKESGKEVDGEMVDMPDNTPKSRLSPETYIGSNRMEYLIPNGNVGVGSQKFTTPSSVPLNRFGFGGIWNVSEEYSTPDVNSTLTYTFNAGKVFLVMRPTSGVGTVEVYLDGKIVGKGAAGADVLNGKVAVDSDRLYELVSLPSVQEHTLKLVYKTPGTEVYAFTFGD